ncbi:MFS sugar transporter-like protein [Coleophoma cylindrospora]|uniref:MFS sugar transporter-like protein n=1 Tax=Coleophoma cylindrospora TaxID=1849047 RepID=A0A3D8R100_9HELO|nr:MFS sugar transporter-like protein [Coleophoma cylindrospora]
MSGLHTPVPVVSSGLARVPRSSNALTALLTISSIVASATLGFDSSMMNNLNILPSYTDYFVLTTATTALNTSAVYIGGCIGGFVSGKIVDLGRKPALLYGGILTLIAVVLQTAAQNVPMFVVARILLGLGTGITGTAASVYLSETTPYDKRAWTVGFFNDCWYVGGLIASGITYGTAKMDSTWAWRLPSALQGIFTIITIILLPFIPESPRWLVYQDRHTEALEVLALTHANGDTANPIVLVQYKEIMDTIQFEKEAGKTLSFAQTVKTPSARKRMELMMSVAVTTSVTGNAIISYYLGTMLDAAGVTNTTTQLEISIILNVWCLVVSIAGTLCANKMGRKTLACISTALPMLFLFLVGMMTKLYGNSTYTPAIYGTVALIFLFQGSYSFGWTPLTYLYPAEVLNYSIRSSGMSVYLFAWNGLGLLVTFAWPFALDSLAWKAYMLNGAWDAIELAYVACCWVETGGKTLEEIDVLFDGEKHSDVPDLEAVMNGKTDVLDLDIGIGETRDVAQVNVTGKE